MAIRVGPRRKLFRFLVTGACVALLGGVTAALAGSSRSSSFPNANGPVTSPTTISSGPPAPPTAPVLSTPGGAVSGVGAFNAIACPNTSTCVAVGATNSGSAAISVSNDGGDSWTSQPLSSTTPELDAVSCNSSTACVAVGPDVALTTSDGGMQWTPATLPASDQTLLGVSCSGQGQCIAVGVSPNHFGPFTGIIDTSLDGGTSWTLATLPSADIPGLNDVACPTTNECVAVGDAILTSNDGGQTWSRQTVPNGMDGVKSIACPSSNVCIAIGPNASGVSNPSSGADEVISTDGGSTWTNEAMPAGTWNLEQVVCAGTTTCYSGGVPTTGAGAGVFLVSGNQSSSWSSLPPPGDLTAVAAMACGGSTNCVAVGQSTSGPAIAATSDGTTWSVQPVPSTASSQGPTR